MTTAIRPYPTRVAIHFAGKDGQIALDQIRTIDKSRLGRRLGAMDAEKAEAVCAVLTEMFAYA